MAVSKAMRTLFRIAYPVGYSQKLIRDRQQLLERKHHVVGFGELALVFSVSSLLLNVFVLFTLIKLSKHTHNFLRGW